MYKALPPHFMTSHHIIYEITCTVFMISPPLSLKWHPPYLSHHDSIDGLRPTLCVTSHPLYGCQLMHSTQRHIHSLWLQALVVITVHPLHSWHQTPYIWEHTHGNTNIISAILPAISNTISTVSVSSKQGINYSTTTLCMISHRICVTSYSVCMLSQQLFMTSSPCRYHITSTPFITSTHPHYIHSIHNIRHPIYEITHMAIQTLYLPSYPLYLTLHPLYLCHQNRVSIISQLLSVWYHIDYMCDILFSMHAITKTVYDIIPLYV